MTTLRRPLKCAVVTVGRSDFSILLPLVQKMHQDPSFEVGFWAGGAHFDKVSGETIKAVRASGLPVWAELKCETFETTPGGSAMAMAENIAAVTDVLSHAPRPDLVIILGDRFEAVAIGLALVPYNLPVAHLSGGSITQGAIDDVFRHCLSKMASMHFCEIPEFAQRIQQMGEDPTTIHTVGALGLDGIRASEPKSFADFQAHFGFSDQLKPGYALATLHPETRSPDATVMMVKGMIKALEHAEIPTIFTYPNADASANLISDEIEQSAKAHQRFEIVKNFGAKWFYTAMEHAGLVIGNSSSGIIEAGSFRMPVVNIGKRQAGRFCAENVIHCDAEEASIKRALAEAVSLSTKERLNDFQNPYGDGRAAERIIAVLKAIDWSADSALKKFCRIDPHFSGALRELP